MATGIIRTINESWNYASVTNCRLTAVGTVETTVNEIVNAKEVVFVGTYIPNLIIPNLPNRNNMEVGWTYMAQGPTYRADGAINVYFETGLIRLQCALFPTEPGSYVEINGVYYR